MHNRQEPDIMVLDWGRELAKGGEFENNQVTRKEVREVDV